MQEQHSDYAKPIKAPDLDMRPTLPPRSEVDRENMEQFTAVDCEPEELPELKGFWGKLFHYVMLGVFYLIAFGGVFLLCGAVGFGGEGDNLKGELAAFCVCGLLGCWKLFKNLRTKRICDIEEDYDS